MRSIVIASVCAAGLLIGAACSTTPEDQAAAKVEDKSGGKPGASAQAVQPPKVAAVDVSKPQAGSLAALKDPNSPLSKRSIFYELDQFQVAIGLTDWKDQVINYMAKAQP